MCDKRVLTKLEAEYVLKIAPHHRKQYRKEKRMYYCEDCHGWHLTSHDNYEENIFDDALKFKKKWNKILKSR